MKMIINGQKVDASDGKTIASINPATGEVIDTFPSATKEDFDRVLAAAQEGKKVWAATPMEKRAEILYRFVDLFGQHVEELARLQCAEMGKTITECRSEIQGSTSIFRNYVEVGKHMDGEVYHDLQAPGRLGDIAFSVREPLGVVVCICPFNYPIDIISHKISAALVMGNAVIIKPPSDVALTLIRFTELMHEAGIPGNVVQVITGPGATVGDYLVDSPLVNAVSFTGSTAVGISLVERGAKYLHRNTMELGGNDPCVIFEDADMETVMREIMCRVANAGQTCCASKRYIVQNTIKDKFTECLIAKLKTVKQGDPQLDETDIGPLVNEKAAVTVEGQVRHTVEQGAKLLLGGTRNGAFFAPTVLGGVTREMDIAKDMEVFGPVFPIIGFDTEEEAVSIANQTSFGLNGAVMSADMKRSVRVASKIEAGTVVTNGASLWRRDIAPFGGYKMSGLGREGGRTALEEMSQMKTLVIKGI